METIPKRLIAPLEATWTTRPDMGQIIDGWSRQTGLAMPKDYRSFLMRFDGGYPYPSLFDIAIPADRWHLSDRVTSCEPLYSFDLALSRWTGDIYGPSTPPDMWFIGSDAFGLELVMSLRAKDHGTVYAWLDRSGDPFGSAENNETHLYQQSLSFTAYIDSLYDTPDGRDHAHWATPRHKMLARDLILT